MAKGTGRISKIESLRLLAMYFIVLAHYLSADNWLVSVDPNSVSKYEYALHISAIMLGQVGVSLFLLISGYFLAKTRSLNPVKRAGKLIIETFAYSFPILVIFYCLLKGGLINGWGYLLTADSILSSLFPIGKYAYWYVSTYFAVLLASPFVIALYRNMNRENARAFLGSLFLVFFAWKIINQNKHFSTDFTYQLFVFSLGCYFSLFADPLWIERNRKRLLYCVAPALMLTAYLVTLILIKLEPVLGAYGYHPFMFIAGVGSTPVFSIALASCLFLYVVPRATSEMPSEGVRGGVLEFVSKLSPGTLGVYLIHSNRFVQPVLWSIVFSGPEPGGALAKSFAALGGSLGVFAIMLVVSRIWMGAFVGPVIHMSSPLLERVSEKTERFYR